jgi:hypothetical protein
MLTTIKNIDKVHEQWKRVGRVIKVGKLNLPPLHLTPHPYILPELTNLPFILFNFLYYLFYRSFTPFRKQHTPQQFNCSGKFNNVPV